MTTNLTRMLKTASENDPESLQVLCKELVRRGYLEESLFDPYPYLGGLIKGFNKNGKIIHLMKVDNHWGGRDSFCGWRSDAPDVDVDHLNKICKICILRLKQTIVKKEAAMEALKKAAVKMIGTT